jgi:hypothetical protein
VSNALSLENITSVAPITTSEYTRRQPSDADNFVDVLLIGNTQQHSGISDELLAIRFNAMRLFLW